MRLIRPLTVLGMDDTRFGRSARCPTARFLTAGDPGSSTSLVIRPCWGKVGGVRAEGGGASRW
jgi:hypothetical protein